MKKKFKLILMGLLVLFMASCSVKTDDLENAKIYTSVYPINFLTNYLYGDYADISSIYPINSDIDSYKLTSKRIKEYSKADLFIYNGLTDEKDVAQKLIDQNNKLLIIDVSYGLSLQNDVTELWLDPKNYLMLAKNIKNNLEEYINSKYIIEDIEKKYDDFIEKTSYIEANLYSLGKDAASKDKNIIIASSNKFNYLEHYGFKVISLEDDANLKNNKYNSIVSNYSSKKYKYILTVSGEADSEKVSELVDKYGAKKIEVDTLTNSLTDDYFNIMNEYIQNIKLFTE